MKPAPFAYHPAGSLAAARQALAGGTGKLSAGNQSLGPMLNLRLARPVELIDIAGLPELRTVTDTGAAVRLGAAITHAEIEDGAVADPTPGWLAAAAGAIAHRAVRNRGTLGGSIAHADPAADWVIVMTGLGASLVLAGPGGERTLPAEDFFTGAFETALGDGEMILAVEIPKPGAGARWGYWKYCRQVGEFAKASATVLDDPASGRQRVALGALGGPPLTLDDAASLLAGRTDPAEAVRAALAGRIADPALHIVALRRALQMAGDTA
ncbi:MAG: FAD binding domain-containing protein [Acuticoccus sp.]